MPEATAVPAETINWVYNAIAFLLLAIASWGVYRFIDLTDKRFDKGETRMEDIETDIERTRTRLTRLETEHRLRHGGMVHEHHRSGDEITQGG